MFTPSQDQARQIFFDTWQKFQDHAPLQGLEHLVLDAILKHPEYHVVLGNPRKYRQHKYSPDAGVPNPFLHMWLHVAVLEQLSVNQPVGIVELYQRLCQRFSTKEAEHVMTCALEKMIWRTQRYHETLDSAEYLALIQTISEQ